MRKTRSIRLRWVLSRVAVAAIAGLVFAPPVAGQATKPRPPDVHYVPTPQSVVDAMLDMAQVTKNDVVYDLGCGDGRIVIAAAMRGARGVGIDIDRQLIREANAQARDANVDDRVQFLEADLFKADISKATVVTLYLLTSLNLKLQPKLLKELKPGTRIVSHTFDMGAWKPEQTVQVDDSTIYLWKIPASRDE